MKFSLNIKLNIYVSPRTKTSESVFQNIIGIWSGPIALEFLKCVNASLTFDWVNIIMEQENLVVSRGWLNVDGTYFVSKYLLKSVATSNSFLVIFHYTSIAKDFAYSSLVWILGT